jgi:O-antigen/teichoic acid export membrane protein
MTSLQQPSTPPAHTAGSFHSGTGPGRATQVPEGTPEPIGTTPERGPARSRIAHGALALLSTQPLTWAASLMLAVALPHYLGGRALGEYTTAFTIAGLVGILASLGVPTYLVRSVATTPRDAAANVGGSIVLIVSLTALTTVLLSALSPFLHLPVSSEILALVLAGSAIAGAQLVVFSQLIGQERHVLFAWLNAGGVLLGAVAGVAALAAGWGLIGLIGVTTFIAIAHFGITWHLSGATLRRDSFALHLWGELARGGMPFLGWNLALRIYGEVDKLLLALIVPTAVVGWYGAAYRIIGIPVFVPTLITTPLLPALSRQVDDRVHFTRTMRRATVWVLLLTVPISAAIVVAAPAIPGILHWPVEFRGSVPLMMILALHQPFVAVDMVLATGLIALRRERKWLIAGLAASVFNVALNLILIPVFQRSFSNGAVAAAIITDATELLMCAGALVLLPRDLLGKETAATCGKILLAGVVFWLTSTALRAAPLPLSVAAGGASFLLACGLMRTIQPDDVTFMREIVVNRFRTRLGGPAR